MLVAVDVEMLAEIALGVEQADGDQRDSQAAGALDVVAGQDAEAAGINRHRFVDAELGRKIDNGLGSEHAGVDRAPGVLRSQIFLHPPVGLVDPAIKHQFGGPGLEPLRRELCQEGDRVVVKLPPADRIELPEEVGHLGVPAPPEVAGQRDALVVEVLRREFIEPRGHHAGGGNWCGAGERVFGLAHGWGSRVGVWSK